MNTGQETLKIFGNRSIERSKMSVLKVFLLGIMAGAFIALGYLAFIRITGTLPKEWGSLGTYLGAAIFPIGLIAIVFIGGELLTGNMMAMTLGYLEKKVTMAQVLRNWVLVAIGNLVGGVLVAYFFGHLTGLTEGAFLEKTLAVANAKVADPPMVAFLSGIGCNIFVCMAVWLATDMKEPGVKFFACWMPIMVFVGIGFQHVVANMFIIPAAMFSGASEITLGMFGQNMLFVGLGNLVGGALCMGVPCYLIYRTNPKAEISKGETKKEETAEDKAILN